MVHEASWATPLRACLELLARGAGLRKVVAIEWFLGDSKGLALLLLYRVRWGLKK